MVRAGEGSNLGLARAAVLLRVTRGVYFARTVPNQIATDALAPWAGPPKTTQPLRSLGGSYTYSTCRWRFEGSCEDCVPACEKY